MHFSLALFSVVATWKWAHWKNWEHYHSTMLFILSGGLLYEYMTRDNTMWVFHPDFLYNQQLTVIVYAVITMPLSVLIFLSRYPEDKDKKIKIIYFVKWVAIYAFVEFVLQICGRISYQHGWNFGYSILFDVMMFPILRLHHVKPLIAYVLSLLIIIFLMWCFKVSLK